MPQPPIEETTPFERLALLSVVDLARRGDSPAHSYDVRRACESHAEAVDQLPFGGVSRRDVITALDALADADLLTKDEVQSPVGKWRPAYGLAVEAETVLTAFETDDPLGVVATRVLDGS